MKKPTRLVIDWSIIAAAAAYAGTSTGLHLADYDVDLGSTITLSIVIFAAWLQLGKLLLNSTLVGKSKPKTVEGDPKNTADAR